MPDSTPSPPFDLSEADACRMLMPDEVSWEQVGLETLRELTQPDELPTCEAEHLVGPAYWEDALAERNRRDPNAAYDVAVMWLGQRRGDGWSQALAWSVVAKRNLQHAFELVRESSANVHAAVVAQALEAHEDRVRREWERETKETGSPDRVKQLVAEYDWLHKLALSRYAEGKEANRFRDELAEVLHQVETSMEQMGLSAPPFRKTRTRP